MSIITTCSILTGDSPIHVEWHKDGQLLDLASLNIHRNEMGDLGSSLVFRSVGPAHAGNYTCIAHNRVGEDRFTAPMVVRSMYPCSNLQMFLSVPPLSVIRSIFSSLSLSLTHTPFLQRTFAFVACPYALASSFFRFLRFLSPLLSFLLLIKSLPVKRIQFDSVET